MSAQLPEDAYQSRREAFRLVLSLTALLSLLLIISGKIVASNIARQQAEIQVSHISNQLASHNSPGTSRHQLLKTLLMNDSILEGQVRLGEQLIASKPEENDHSANSPGFIDRFFGGISDITSDSVLENQLNSNVRLRVFAPFQFNAAIAALGLACIAVTGTAAYRRNRQFSDGAGDETRSAGALDFQYSLLSPARRDESMDISKRELELAQESALKANRFKSHLLSRTSHELLTPLNSIIGFNRLLQSRLENLDDPQVQRYLDLVQHNAEYINTLVSDLVFFADRNKSRQPLQYESVDIHTLINSICQSLENDALKKNLAYTANFESLGNTRIHTDPVRLRQIAYNLIVNAIRYTDEGSITLAAWIELEGEKSVFNFSVTDTGRGIDATAQRHIFSSFVTSSDSDNGTSDDPGLGLGLGLTVVRDLTHLLGGKLTLKSEPGVGSCFALKLPVHIDTSSAGKITGNDSTEHEDPVTTPGKSLLVVDDNAANCYLIEQLLEKSNWNVFSANSAGDAIALAETMNFDRILLDIRMSPVDGYELLGELRKTSGHTNTPVIACTAHTSEIEFNRLVKSGFRHVIHKPVSAAKLITLLNEPEDRLAALKPDAVTSNDAELANRSGQNVSAHHFFDKSTALKRAGNNPETAKNIYALLLKDLRQLHRDYRSIDNHNSEVILDIVHKVHGAAALSGTEGLREKASTAENCLKNSANPNEIKNALTDLFTYLDQLLAWADATPAAALFDLPDA